MTIHLDRDLPDFSSRHQDLLRQLSGDPSQYLEEIPHAARPRLVLKNVADEIVDEIPLSVEALQALIDLMTVGALERYYFPGQDRRVAYRLAGRHAAHARQADGQRRIA
ncbi:MULTISPECIES: hypothetical protein [unclassified Beijerinckia]|uniref:hypothetical protein n=1 Tax=unclassified Beijerinckia TaxID=2638183 RepID=UPI001114B508|nr:MULTISPECIES: hypothetical protein [unclassified Beijerinckia]MDH7794983.1 hypothetical protein [Beijerinckia sp. GAS462]